MQLKHIITIAALAVLVTLLAAGCHAGNGSAATGKDQGTVSSDIKAPTSGPGIDFKKIDIGLPSRTLDYIGDKATGLAGARAGRKLFFGANEEGSTNIFCRDLGSFERTFVGRIDSMVPATLACSADGKYLSYCRARKISTYIDDPTVTYPEAISLPCRMDVKAGKEEELFDFRDPQWRPYRSDQYSPFISPDGKQVVVMSYNLDKLILKRQLSDWLALEADYTTRLNKMPEKEKTETLTKLRQLLTAPNVLPLLKEKGLTPPETGAVTDQERAAMKALFNESVKPQGALLIWRDGKSQLLPLTFAPEYAESFHFIITASQDAVLLGAQDLAQEPASPHAVFRVDMQTGAVTLFASYLGAPSSLELDKTGKELILVYNPVDSKALKILTETRLRRIPLDGSQPTEIRLPGDFLGFMDVSQDGALVAGQDRDDNDLYLIDVAGGTKKKLEQLQAEIAGVFLPEGGDRAVYVDNGILYGLEIPVDPEASPQWVKADYFAQYTAPITKFFTDLGFTMPADLTWEWEEKQGLGEHEVSAAFHTPAKPAAVVLVRYSLTKQRMVSVWFTNGYPFPIAADLQGAKLDFFGCKDIAEKALNRVQWLNPDTRQEYHPGPNPLYDGKSNSYIVTYRDGYWFGSGKDAKWVINSEATMRISAADGAIAELTLSEMDPVQAQPMSITLEKAVFMIRNEGQEPIPEDAPIKFDTQNYRLVVAQKHSENWGPVKYQGELVSRLAYEIDAYLQPENDLIMTSLVDTETGELLGQLDYQPSGIAPMRLAQ